MRTELTVDLRPNRSKDHGKPAAAPEAQVEKQRRDREERMLRRIALAQVIESSITIREFNDMADVARHCGVSRARVSQVFDLARS